VTAPRTPDGGHDIRTIRSALVGANDDKVRRVLALVEEAGDPHAAASLLDPLRPRLARLRPPRRLRFARCLFMPLDQAIVPARGWRPGDPSVPRSIVPCFADHVRAAMGSEAAVIQRLIDGNTNGAMEVISRVGQDLWPRAAEILLSGSPADGWVSTGLPADVATRLANVVAAILRRGPLLWQIVCAARLGGTELNDSLVETLVCADTDEPTEARAVVTQIILEHWPDGAAVLRRMAVSATSPGERIARQQVLDLGMAHLRRRMTDSVTFPSIGAADLIEANHEVRRINRLLTAIEADAVGTEHTSRATAIRRRFDQACRTRFADGVRDVIIEPLAVTAEPIGPAVQVRLEGDARALHNFSSEARHAANPAAFDAMLAEASAAIESAAEAGTLSPVRAARLIEILAGSDAAEAVYRQASSIGQKQSGDIPAKR